MTKVSKELFEGYLAALTKWNAKINLVASATPAEWFKRHFEDSAFLLPYIDAPAIDVGSGAGFPALVLAILGAPIKAVVESDSRKCAFLSEICRLYKLDVSVLNERVEGIAAPYPIITGRAFAPLARFFELTKGLCAPDTKYVLLKGDSVQAEIEEALLLWDFEYELVKKDGGVVFIARSVREK